LRLLGDTTFVREVDLKKLELATSRLGETVLDPAQWPDVMAGLCEAVGATGAVMLQSDMRTPDVPRTKSIDELVKAYFTGNWHLNDDRAARAVPLQMAGATVIADQDIFTAEDISRQPIYNEFLHPIGLHWFTVVGFRAGSALWGLSFQRTSRDGQLEERGRQVLSQLSQRLTEVATISTAVARMAASSVTNALNCIRQAALVIDRNGRVSDVNSQADDMFDGDIRVHNRRLVVRDQKGANAPGPRGRSSAHYFRPRRMPN
jgi:PAS domain-containing protein